MSAATLKHSTFLWLEVHLRTRKVCKQREENEQEQNFFCTVLRVSAETGKCLKEPTGTHPDGLPEQDIQGGVSVD